MTCHTGDGTGNLPQSPLAGSVNAIFLHHSTGGRVWNAGAAAWFTQYNTTNSKNYEVTQENFHPSGNDPYDYWNLWINTTTSADTHHITNLVQQYNVIIIKHCYPVSYLNADSANASVSSANRQIQNYKLQYAALKTEMLKYPDNRFILWTGAAAVAGDPGSSAANAARSREFFTWVKNDWDTAGDNIYLWDFFELETEGDNTLKSAYAASATDSHPNSSFCNQVYPLFCQRVIDVIEGRGDTASITGK